MPQLRNALFAVLAIAACALPSEVVAQAPTRTGFFIGFGLGWGSLGFEDGDEREGGVAGYFKIGGAISPSVLLGAESNGWYKEELGIAITSGNLSAVAYVYPNPASGFYLKGGLGLARLEVDAGSFGSASDEGLGLTLGAGYDIGFGGRFALTPFANLVYGSFDGGSTNTLQFGLGVNWY
jgi:hypothetical protein